MKTVYVQRGRENSGKSTTIRIVYDLLLAQHPNAISHELLDNENDIRVIIEIGGRFIGIESYGDPWKMKGRMIPSLRRFVARSCDVIVCATRTDGNTVAEVRKLECHGYDIVWRDRGRDADGEWSRKNREEAQWIVDQVDQTPLALAI